MVMIIMIILGHNFMHANFILDMCKIDAELDYKNQN